MSRVLIFALLVSSLGLLGCERRDASRQSAFKQQDYESVVLIAIDLSGSFRDDMSEDGKAYDFVLRAIDEYFRQRIGGNDQLIITQLSGNSRPLLWQGTPQELRRQFPNAAKFRDFLLASSDPNASRINDGIAESLEYVLGTHSVASGRAKTVALILSDMQDNASSDSQSDQRLMNALISYARHGAIGFYFCDQQRMTDIRQKMSQAGIDMYTLEGDFRGRPPLPNFDWASSHDPRLD